MSFTYNDRELSNLDFISRVLTIASNPKVPLIERFRYVCICCSLLDEFFEIRFSSVLEEAKNTKNQKNIQKKIDLIQKKSKKIEKEIQAELFGKIIPELRNNEITLFIDNDWPEKYSKTIKRIFTQQVKPYLNLIVLNVNRPFPKMINKSTGYFVELQEKDTKQTRYAIVQIPRMFQRVYELPKQTTGARKYGFVFLVAMMREFASILFPDHNYINEYQFKVTRNSDLLLSAEDMDDLRDSISGKLMTRQTGEPVRIETSTRMPKNIVKFIADNHDVTTNFVHPFRGTPSLANYIGLLDHINNPSFFFPKHQPRKINFGEDIFQWIKEKDRLAHHPYESFDIVNQFVKSAATDPNVVSIKQTIYRADKKSKLIQSLMEASINGIDVNVVIELQARFDEEANLKWAEKLENVGAHVVHGKPNFKCHAKLLIISRKEINPNNNKPYIQHYAHLGTGNYSAGNARSYTDFGLFTADKTISNDILMTFDFLSGVRKEVKPKEIINSPEMHMLFLKRMISHEIKQVKLGKTAEMIIKVNSLTDTRVIDMLYRASNSGVRITMIIRGVSRLIPGVKGQSENIRVLSTVGRFLEHHRIFYFYHGGKELVYCSSADWMERNLSRRTEVTFPIKNQRLKERVIDEALYPHIDSKHTYWLSKKLDYSLKNKKGDARHPNEIALEKSIIIN
ncbi:MAG: polyphosphate kinase 1 [Methylophilaceae bacterium]